MKVDLRQEERTAATSSDATILAPTDVRSRWPFVATALVLVTLAIAAFAAMNGRTSPEQATHAVYLDPMTAAREGGPYAQPAVGPWVDAMTGAREGGGYAQPAPEPYADGMTGIREGGAYATTP